MKLVKFLLSRKEKYHDKSDNELFVLMMNDKSKEEAFSELYARYAKYVYSYCYYFLNNEEDTNNIFQETFLRFYSCFETLENKNIKAYLITIAKHLAINYLNRNKVQDDLRNLNKNYAKDTNDPLKQLCSNELRSTIHQKLNELTELQKEIFILKECDGFSYEEIASIMNVSKGTVRVNLYRARNYLKNELKECLIN